MKNQRPAPKPRSRTCPEKPAGRSRKLYILWAIALTLLLLPVASCRRESRSHSIAVKDVGDAQKRTHEQALAKALMAVADAEVVSDSVGFVYTAGSPLDEADEAASEARSLQKAGKPKRAAAARKKAVGLYLKAEAWFLKLPQTSLFYEEGLYLAGIACYRMVCVLNSKAASPAEKKQLRVPAERALKRFETYKDWVEKHPPKSLLDDPEKVRADIAQVKRRRGSHVAAIRLYCPYIHAGLGNWRQVQSTAGDILARSRSLAKPLLSKKDLSPRLKNSLRSLLVKAHVNLASKAGDAEERAQHLCAAAKHLKYLNTAAEKSSDPDGRKRLRALCIKHMSRLTEGLKAGIESAKVFKLLQQDEDGRWLLEKIKDSRKKGQK